MWEIKHLDIDFDESYKNFNYIKKPIPDAQIKEWRKQGHTNLYFNGEMYDSQNSMPSWVNLISNFLNLKNCGFVFYKMTTGTIMPFHRDHFDTYYKKFKVEKNRIKRALYFLEDRKPGHFIEVEDFLFSNYKKGDILLWDSNVVHAAGNYGIEDRYTLQITGHF